MSAAAILSTLAERGIEVTANNDALRVVGRLTAADVKQLRAYKPALLRHLKAASNAPSLAAVESQDDALLAEARQFAAERRADAGPTTACSWCDGRLFWRYGHSWRCWYCVDYSREQANAVAMCDDSPLPAWLDDPARWVDGCGRVRPAFWTATPKRGRS